MATIKRVFILVAAAMLTVACNVHELTGSIPSEEKSNLDGVVAVVNDFESQFTRTSITQDGINPPSFAWKEGDEMGVVPADGQTYQTNFKVKQIDEDPHTASFDGGEWSLKAGKSYAAYYPCVKQVITSEDSIAVSVKGQIQTKNSSTAHLGDFDYMYAPAAQESNGNVCFEFKHLISLIRIQVAAPAAAEFTEVSLKTTEAAFARSGLLDLKDGTFVKPELAESLNIALEDVSVAKDSSLTFWLAALPTAATSGKDLTLILKGADGTEYSYGCGKGFALESGKAYSVTAGEPVPESKASLTYDEVPGNYAYGTPFKYTNDSGEWTICVYSNSTASVGFQINNSKVAYIGTPIFSKQIKSIQFETTKSYSGLIYLCSKPGDTSAEGILGTFEGNGTKLMAYDVEDLEANRLYIRSSKAMNIKSILIEFYNGSSEDPEDTPFTRTSEVGFYESTDTTPLKVVGLPEEFAHYSSSFTGGTRTFRFIDLSAGQISGVKFAASIKHIGSTFTLQRIDEGKVNKVEDHTVKIVNISGKMIWLEDKTSHVGYIIETE